MADIDVEREKVYQFLVHIVIVALMSKDNNQPANQINQICLVL